MMEDTTACVSKVKLITLSCIFLMNYKSYAIAREEKKMRYRKRFDVRSTVHPLIHESSIRGRYDGRYH